jgi:hypothetical protein
MANPYFRQVPNLDYVSRLPNAKIGDYIQVKNLFKKGKLREDIFQNLAFFEKYKILGDNRPDNVAFEVYGDSTLDWVVLLSNNIVNIQSEWPLTQNSFDDCLFNKYMQQDDYTEEDVYNSVYNGIHHYETTEVKNSQGVVIVPAGLQVSSDYSVSYYDYFIDNQVDSGNIAVPVTNYEYEEKLNNDKRNIYLLKSTYLNIILDDMNDNMQYKKGSSQYVSETLKRADNIRLTS